MLSGPASICFRSPSGSPPGSSYATSSGPKHDPHAKIGPRSKSSPHSRQDRATAGPKGAEAEVVELSTDCTAMEARPSLLIFLGTHFATRRNWHLPELGASLQDARPAGGLPGLQRAVPSAPLDERYGRRAGPGAFVRTVPP